MEQLFVFSEHCAAALRQGRAVLFWLRRLLWRAEFLSQRAAGRCVAALRHGFGAQPHRSRGESGHVFRPHRVPLRLLAWLSMLFSGMAALCAAVTLAVILARGGAALPAGEAFAVSEPPGAAEENGESRISSADAPPADGAQGPERVAAQSSAAMPDGAQIPQSTAVPSPADHSAAPCLAPVDTYQTLYPALYAVRPAAVTPADKTVYLTFDDGPSRHTADILAVLAQYDVRATWFVVGTQLEGREDLVRAIAAAGHTVALHSDTHEYQQIYASVESFLADLDALSQKVTAITGQSPALVRFPGGSINAYDAGLYPALCAELLRRGYSYYDWNVSAQDAASPAPSAQTVSRRVISGVQAQPFSVVLMHDTKAATADALGELIPELLAEGYTFAPLDAAVPMVSFGYPSLAAEDAPRK